MNKKYGKPLVAGSAAAQENIEKIKQSNAEYTEAAEVVKTTAKPKRSRTQGEDWILIQARIPINLHKRFMIYMAENNLTNTKMKLVEEALEYWLDSKQG
ncbi:MAG: hypothetical protein HUK05_04230 [Prevotella sp.]|nr:hypothetical protein [Prevotella sp.]MCF0209077.1 hypothetical protein [Bacteroidaceae bacterium]MCF0243431.1 hypothetical protein [Bacteroidaceae bacterium]